MGDDRVKKLTDEELDHLLVEMIMKMSPEQLDKAAEMVFAAAEDEKPDKGDIVA